MKAVPLLAITNAITLGLVILLFFQQGEPKPHVRTRGAQAPVDLAALEARLLAKLNRDRPFAAPLPGEVHDRAAVEEEGGDGRASDALAAKKSGSDVETPEMSGAFMETFRQNVRKAQILNREEDRLTQVVGQLDRLISSNRIGALNESQKHAVARTLLGARDKAPRIFRRMRDPAFRELPREERAKIFRVEFGNLRDETQKALEEIVPGADAKTIVEQGGLRGGGDGGFGRPVPRRSVNPGGRRR